MEGRVSLPSPSVGVKDPYLRHLTTLVVVVTYEDRSSDRGSPPDEVVPTLSPHPYVRRRYLSVVHSGFLLSQIFYTYRSTYLVSYTLSVLSSFVITPIDFISFVFLVSSCST